MGIKIPNVGKRKHSSKRKTAGAPRHGMMDALFSSSRQQVLGLIFGQPERRFSITELIELAGVGSGAVQREVQRLAESGLVSTIVEMGRKLYQANPGAPVFQELKSIVDKTIGIPGQLYKALESAADQIQFALLYGSLAKGQDRASSDIDVLIVSDELGLEEIFTLLAPAERQLGRKINPTIYTRDEFLKRRQAEHPFLSKVLSGKHHILFGSEIAAGTETCSDHAACS